MASAIQEWLCRLESIGVRIELLPSGHINLRPKSKIPADWIPELQRLKPELVQYLRTRDGEKPELGHSARETSQADQSPAGKAGTGNLPPKRLVLKLPDGCPGFCQLDLREIRAVESNPCRDKEASYRCRDCGREYRLLHELGGWVHPAAEGAILPGPPCLPGGTALAGWPPEIPAPAWLEDLLRDFASVIIRAGRQIAHAPEKDCRFPVAIFWQPPDGPPHWSCPACGWRSVKVLDQGQVVDCLGFPLPEALPEPTAET